MTPTNTLRATAVRAADLDFNELGRSARESADEAHDYTPHEDTAWSFLVDNPECFGHQDWPADMPEEVPAIFTAAYWGYPDEDRAEQADFGNRPNMSYCMFENTLHALRQVMPALDNARFLASLSRSEREAFESLLEICREIIEEEDERTDATAGAAR